MEAVCLAVSESRGWRASLGFLHALTATCRVDASDRTGSADPMSGRIPLVPKHPTGPEYPAATFVCGVRRQPTTTFSWTKPLRGRLAEVLRWRETLTAQFRLSGLPGESTVDPLALHTLARGDHHGRLTRPDGTRPDPEESQSFNICCIAGSSPHNSIEVPLSLARNTFASTSCTAFKWMRSRTALIAKWLLL